MSALDSFFQLLKDALESSDVSIKKNAESEVLKQMEEDSLPFLRKCVQLIIQDGATTDTIICGGTFANRFLTYQIQKQIQIIKKQLNLPENSGLLTDLIKAAMLMIHNDGVTNVQVLGSKLFSLCFGINSDCLSEQFDMFCTEISKESTSNGVRYALFQILYDIADLKNLKELLRPSELKQKLISLFELIVACVKKETSEPEESNIELRIHACKVITHFLEITKQDVIPIELIESLLRGLSNSFVINNTNLFHALHDVMFEIFKSYYKSMDGLMPIIFEYAKNGIVNKDLPDEYHNISMKFLRSIADYELKETETSKNYSVTCGVELFDAIAFYLTRIDPEDTGIEDTSVPQPSMVATMALSYLFKVGSREFFPKLVDLFKAYVEDKSSWIPHHASLLILSVLTSRIEESVIKRQVTRFLSDNFKYAYESMDTSNMRVRETAMWVTGIIIGRYPTIVSDPPKPVEVVRQIFNYISSPNEPIDQHTHKTIILRAINISYYIFKAFKPNNLLNPLTAGENGLFKPFLDFIMSILQLPQSDKNERIVGNAFESLNCLYLSAQMNAELFTNELKRIIQDIRTLMAADMPENSKFRRLSGLCSNISSLVARLNERARDMFPEITDLLFSLLSTRNPLIYEEAPVTFATIICRSEKVQTSIPDMGRMMEVINDAINTHKYEIIKSVRVLISDLFIHFGGLIIEYFLPMVERLGSFIESEETEKELKPQILMALSDVLLGIGKDPETSEAANHFRDIFFDTLIQCRDLEVDNTTEEGRNFGCDNYEAVTHGFEVYAMLFYHDLDALTEKKLLQEMSKVSQAITKFHDVNNDVLRNALLMYFEFAKRCSRRNAVLLNRGCNHKVINMAAQIKELSDMARNVMKALHIA